MLSAAIETAATLVDLAGIAVVLWGAGGGVVGLVAAHVSKGSGGDALRALGRLRCQVGSHILLGLEILIASDVARTALEPSRESVLLLGAVVFIRTLLGFFLSREIESLAQPR